MEALSNAISELLKSKAPARREFGKLIVAMRPGRFMTYRADRYPTSDEIILVVRAAGPAGLLLHGNPKYYESTSGRSDVVWHVAAWDLETIQLN